MIVITPFTDLHEGDPRLKECLNFNPWHSSYTKKQQAVTGRNPNETDRGGWRGYNRVYSKYLWEFQDEKFNLLEIGVHSGYGLLAWARYFPKVHVTGVESDTTWVKNHLNLLKEHDEFSRVKIQYFDSREKTHWNMSVFDTFKVIIDDGSHLPLDQVDTFKATWDLLEPGGYYFIEDISARYYNPGKEVVFNMLEKLEEQGHYVAVYSHRNEGWANILANKEVWPRFGVTEKTPKLAEDYIAVIRKKK
jgi:hypothetical protein